jgi:sortase (surface protein transpeptidase)
VAGERRVRTGPLLLSILIPALVAGGLTAQLVLPDRSRGEQAPVAKVPDTPRDPDEPTLGGPDTRSHRTAVPLQIRIPAAGVKGPVDPIRAIRGQLEIPPAGRAGWFRAGPRPGEPGRSVIVSHVDSQQGPALFADLKALGRGSRIQVRDRAGDVHRYRLTRRRQVAKSHFKPSLVYGPSAKPTLVLVTCGGPFTPGEGYRDNVILYAQSA